MKGDFSRWNPIPANNEQGVLYQQGRVFNDADLTAGERIALHWRSQAAKDIIGSAVAAVPATDPSGYKVLAASVSGDIVELKIGPGRIWADGILLYLPADPADPAAPVILHGSYFGPPINAAGVGTGSIGGAVRDLVVLEISLQEFSGFQDPGRLIEPALGGPDTTERVVAGYEFRLLRLGKDEHCHNVRDRLADTPQGKGRLSVKLEEPAEDGGDCPVAAGGGYTGFEHYLYRIEIAHVGGGLAPHFKWSTFNGGLVGRGVFHHNSSRYVEVQGNRTAIINSGLIDFYLEAMQYDGELGAWRVVYGTRAHLNSGHDLELDHPPTFGTFPSTSDPIFFRLWNDIEPISDYTETSPKDFRDGIKLRFDPPAANVRYRPGDFWNFTVRAGGIPSPQTLIDDQPPEGMVLRRVPLAEIQWTNDRDTDISGLILDCRRRFLPLSRQKQCCSLTVGDGINSFGDFNSLELAAAHLPPSGGELCLLPGRHFGNLVLTGKENIHIRGCENRTLIMPRLENAESPVIQIIQGKNIQLSGLDIFAPFGAAIKATGSVDKNLHELKIEHCRMLAKTYALYIHLAEQVTVGNNRLWLLDQSQGRATISLRVRYGLVERNGLGVWPFKFTPPDQDDDDDGGDTDLNDDCLTLEQVYGQLTLIYAYLVFVWQNRVTAPPPQPYRAIGGIHLRGGCEHVRILENHIDGGAGHGVVLGGLLPGEEEIRISDDEDEPLIAIDSDEFNAIVANESDNRIAKVDMYLSRNGLVNASGVSDSEGLARFEVKRGSYNVGMPGYRIVSVSQSTQNNNLINSFKVTSSDKLGSLDRASLYRITIQENSIERMALSGIGFAPFLSGKMDIEFPNAEDPSAVAAFIAALLAPKDLVASCNIVRELVIHNNHIIGNLLAGFNEFMRTVVKRVGLGGISLAMVENAEISDNHIQANGVDASRPTCGIFIGYGEDVEITRNQIHENGPLTEDYERERIQGLRGGIFVRFASALLLGGEKDRLQKPALSIRDNHIDQPAGRAITAFAYGPVNCVGNYLNSEREGFFTFMDNLVGAVMLVNLGGVHRQLAFSGKFIKGTEITQGRQSLALAEFQDVRQVEILLPGGETLVNSNQIRLGPDHQALTAQILFSLDDLGIDGNQSSVFRPDLLFANVVAAGSSVRVTDNRFRDWTIFCPFSLLSVAYGISAFAKLLAMNNTANNQGEHCIVALSNGSMPVVDEHNLELTPLCAQIGNEANNKIAYFRKALVGTLLARSMLFKTEDAAKEAVAQGAVKSYQGVEELQMNYQKRQGQEAFRLQTLYGEQRADVQLLKSRVRRQSKSIEVLRLQRQLIELPEVEKVEDSEGAVIDGRVTDERLYGRKDLVVELVDANNESLKIRALTDESGYYAISLDAKNIKEIARRGKVYVRVLDASGKELSRVRKALRVKASERVRTNIVLKRKPVVIGGLTDGDRIFEVKKPTTERIRELSLNKVPGIHKRLLDKLKEHNIDTAEKLVATPNIRLAEITGSFPAELKMAAETALKSPELTSGVPKSEDDVSKPKPRRKKTVRRSSKKKPDSDE